MKNINNRQKFIVRAREDISKNVLMRRAKSKKFTSVWSRKESKSKKK